MGYSPWGRKELDTTERLHFLSQQWGQGGFVPCRTFHPAFGDESIVP